MYSTLADGYYVIENLSSTYCISPDAISMSNYVNVSAMSMDIFDSGDTGFAEEIGRKWYIELKEIYQGHAYYTIHPAYSRGIALCLFGGALPVLRPVETFTTNIWHWKIVSGTFYYVLENRHYSDTTISLDSDGGLSCASLDLSDSSQNLYILSTFEPAGLLLFDTVSGLLIGNTWNSLSVSHTAYGAINTDQTLADIGIYLQILDSSSNTDNFGMSFSPAIANFNSSSLKLRGNSIGTTTATITRVMHNTTYSVSVDIAFRPTISMIHYYDSTLTGNSTAIANMTDAVTFANKAYGKYLGLNLLQVSSILMSNAPADTCPFGSTSPCNTAAGCGSGSAAACRNHHKNVYSVSEQYGLNVPDNTIYVLWSDSAEATHCAGQGYEHVLVEYADNPTVFNPTYACVVSNRPFIHVFRFEGTGTSASSTLQQAYMGITLAHEIAHTAGMEDVYGKVHDGEPGYQCMMEVHKSAEMVHFYNNVISGRSSPFCSGCLDALAPMIANNPYDS